MRKAKEDPVVFEKGVHRHVRDGVEVTLVVPEDVRASQIVGPLAAAAVAAREGGDDADAA